MPSQPEQQKTDETKETPSEFAASIASVLVAGLFIVTFIVQAFEIPSGSMKNTLLVGDHLFVDRLTPTSKARYIGPLMPYREIHRGDIIVFLKPSTPGLYLVKRIIGIPGDRLHLRDGLVYRNGERMQEPYVIHRPGDHSPYRDNFPAVEAEFEGNVSSDWRSELRKHIQGEDLVVPPDSYFGMGDNRDNSLDSRYWGFVPRANVVGRPLVIYWSFVTPEDQYQRTLLQERTGFVLYIVTHFASETRWSRMFHLVQ
ncbi:MAG TPA: signal peptidase I [Verrucomicrobiae bacterium]|nr:signal peptidase I [Verrucomicrobiae bacterium]